MAYDLQKIFEKAFGKESPDSLNGQILSSFRRLETNPINIYSWTPDWDYICYITSVRLRTVKSNVIY
jgi:hypothetical protein